MEGQTKTLYTPISRIGTFYTGGPAAPSPDGDSLACACHAEVKVASLTAGCKLEIRRSTASRSSNLLSATAQIILASTGSVLQTLPGDSEPVTALCFGVEQHTLYSSSRSLQLRCWDLRSGQCIRSWKGHAAPIIHMAVDASGALLASGAADRAVRVWDAQGFYCTHVFRGHSAVVLQVLFQSQELNIVSAAEDGEIRIWDLVGQVCLASLKGHFAAVTALALAPDGWTLLSAGRDKVAVAWDLRKQTKLRTTPLYEAVEGAQVLADVDINGVEKQDASLASKPGMQGQKLVYFATAGEAGVVKIWNSVSGQCVLEQKLQSPFQEGCQLTGLGITSKGALLCTTADARILYVEVKAATQAFGKDALSVERGVHVSRELIGHQGEVTDLQFVRVAKEPCHLAVATASAAIRVYDIASCSCQLTLHGHSDVVLSMDVAYSNDGTAILVSGSKDCSFRIWSLQMHACQAGGAVKLQGSPLVSVKGHAAAVTGVTLAKRAPGSFVVSTSTDMMLKVWNTAASLEDAAGDSAALQSSAAVLAHEKDINSVTMSLNETLVCTTSQDRTAKVWKLPSLVLSLKLSGHKRGVWAAAFSPVEQAIATSSGDRTIKLWSLKDGTCLRTFQGHTASALRLLYLSSGTQIISCGADGLVKLWNIRSGECSASFEEHEGRVWALAQAGDSQALLATGGADATVCIWRDATDLQRQELATATADALIARQEFSNALQEGKFQTAATLAFESRQARQVLAIIEKAQQSSANSAARLLQDLVADLTTEQLKGAFAMLRDWNTHTKHCQQAQALLHAILIRHPPKVLRQISGIEAVLAGIGPYTQRHMANMERLQCSSFILDYTLSRLQQTDED